MTNRVQATNGRSIQCGDVVLNHRASVDNPQRSGVVIERGFRIGQLSPGPYIRVADLEGATWEFVGHDLQLEIVGFLGLEHAKDQRS